MENDNKGKETDKKLEEKTGKSSGKKADKKNGSIIMAAIIILLIAAGILFYFLQKPQNSLSPYQLSFANETLNFRAELGKAASVPSLPDGQSIRNSILSANVSRIRISYVPGDYNSFYAADSFEIAYKLVIIMKYYYGTSGYLYAGENGENCFFFENTGKNACIISEPVTSADGIKAGGAERVIFLAGANETSVSLKDNIVYIKGKDFSETGRKYTDLDLATDKFLLALMGK